jgi:hypothetical protein
MNDHSNTLGAGPSTLPDQCWLAGVRYPSGTEIFCASQGGEPAWTPDRGLASVYPSEGHAEMAARLLADGDAVPFWTARAG